MKKENKTLIVTDTDIGYDYRNRLQIRMKELGISQVELAAKTGATRQTIAAYIDGNRAPSITDAWKLVEALHLKTLDDLFFRIPYSITERNKSKEFINKTIGIVTGLLLVVIFFFGMLRQTYILNSHTETCSDAVELVEYLASESTRITTTYSDGYKSVTVLKGKWNF
jgi:transcriptional regulator with XRE-family HTH domain